MAGEVVIGIDTGGTFTDVFTSAGRVYKLPSTPANPSDAIVAGVEAVGVQSGDAVAHGTTVATNAVLERRGAPTTLLTTAGFEDVLEIRRQNRPALYDLLARWPDPLVPVERRLGVPERLDFEGTVVQPIDMAAARELVAAIASDAVAVCLLYSYVNPEHEDAVAELLRAAHGDELALSLSHRIAPQYGEYERTSTTVVNAYVMPVMQGYLRSLQEKLAQLQVGSLHVMHSNGGLIGAEMAAERPVTTILSGPAAGVVGARAIATGSGEEQIITFDMGGTSTDVAVVPGMVLESSEGEVASFPLMIPMMMIETVGAGGGSIARLDAAGGLHVGPESAGAEPGPAAYGRGELPTVTDANLVLGRLSARGLLDGAMPLDLGRSRAALERIAQPLGISVEAAAWAVIRLANSNMERAVRTVTLQRGYDPRRFTLFPFGGAGPLHAAELAAGLGIRRILVPPHPGVVAALGLTVPHLQRDFRRTVLMPLAPGVNEALDDAFARLEGEARTEMAGERTSQFGELTLSRALEVRYRGQSFELAVPYDADTDIAATFHRLHEERYGYAHRNEPVEVVNLRLRAVLPRRQAPHLVPDWPEPGREPEMRRVWFGSGAGVAGLEELDTQVVWRPALSAGTHLTGPAILEQFDSTTVIPPGWTATVDPAFNVVLMQ